DVCSSDLLFGSTPGLKHSHAPTWIPKIKDIGLKQFLASTIDERFDESADPQLVKWFIEQASSNEEMQKRIAAPEVRYYDTSAHNICDGYASRCVHDLMDFLKRRA